MLCYYIRGKFLNRISLNRIKCIDCLLIIAFKMKHLFNINLKFKYYFNLKKNQYQGIENSSLKKRKRKEKN